MAAKLLMLTTAMISTVARIQARTSFSALTSSRPLPRRRRPLSLRATEVCVEEYLRNIEDELLRRGPAMRRSISRPNLKPMIRTLLGYECKIEFDGIVRAARKFEEYERLASFWGESFVPSLSGERLEEKAPGLSGSIRKALSEPPETGGRAFRRLPSGRRYKGNVLDMLEDIAPETVPAYLEASEPLDDRQALNLVIESRRSNVDSARIDAALKCLDAFLLLPCQDEDAKFASKKNGKDSEKACLNFLHEKKECGKTILQNVIINHISCSVRQKYKRGVLEESCGIIWTTVSRCNSCSEFDAVVVDEEVYGVDESASRVAEIWEAKYSVSPSTLWDALAKKLPAARAVMEDDDAVLAYSGGSISMRSCRRTDPKTIFGVYGRELLPVPNAVSQLCAMAAANVLSNDMDALLEAAESGFVTIDTTRCVRDINVLREELSDVEASGFQLTVRIEDGT